MGAHGSLLPASSGHVQSILDVAARLSEEGEHPIVNISGSSTDILITHTDGYTTAVARAIPFALTTPPSHEPQADAAEAGSASEPAA
jgi:hypothetical protein